MIKPAFYQAAWFYYLCSVSLAGLVWLVYCLRVQALTGKVQERLEARAHERIRIARDLHDTLLQGVQGLVLRFHYATEQLPEGEPARKTLTDALNRADQVINEGRDKVRELRDESGVSKNLIPDLKRLADTLSADNGIRISLLVSGDVKPLQSAPQDELYSIARESLTNAVRHSAASHIELSVAFSPRLLRLSCSDNGCGVRAEVLRAGSQTGHWGVVGMRERAVRLGSKLVLTSALGAGAKVEVSVPARKAYQKPESKFKERWFGWLPGPGRSA